MVSKAAPVAAPDAFDQMEQFHAAHRGEMVDEEPRSAVAEGGLPTITTAKGLPVFAVYHLTKFDDEGRVIDYHIDHWQVDYNAYHKKLQRRYGETDTYPGKPIWVEKLPPGASRPTADKKCDFPGCPAMVSSEAEQELHWRAFHREWYEMRRGEADRQRREEEIAALREQAKANQELVAALREQNEMLLEALRPLLQERGTRKGEGGDH